MTSKLYPQIFVRRAEDIPAGEHWAIITSSSFIIPGDERSRTNPGHGYSESTEDTITYEAYLDEEEFKSALVKRMALTRSVKGIHVTAERYKIATNLEKV